MLPAALVVQGGSGSLQGLVALRRSFGFWCACCEPSCRACRHYMPRQRFSCQPDRDNLMWPSGRYYKLCCHIGFGSTHGLGCHSTWKSGSKHLEVRVPQHLARSVPLCFGILLRVYELCQHSLAQWWCRQHRHLVRRQVVFHVTEQQGQQLVMF